MEEYKKQYNKLLERYNNGIKYLEQNPSQIEKWGIELDKIVNELGNFVETYNIPEENIL